MSQPDSWSNTTGIAFQSDGAGGFSGSKSIKISNPSSWAGYAPNYVIPYESNKAYTLSVVAKAINLSNLSGAYIKFNFYNSSLTQISGTCASNTLPKSNANWTGLVAFLDTNAAPAGTAYIKPVITAGSLTGTVYFDDMRLNEAWEAGRSWVGPNAKTIKNGKGQIIGYSDMRGSPASAW